MASQSFIDAAWHPLTAGLPPEWASEWGQDSYGVFVAFSLGDLIQRLRWIPPGRFLVGSPEDETRGLAKEAYEREWFEREHPRHPVFITRGFWLFDTPCTQALWETVMGANPSRFKSPDRPVEQVSWNDVRDFLQRLNARIPGLNLMLPSEAQWEYACRAGTDTALYSGPIDILGANNAPALDPIAWYGGNSGEGFERAGTHPVGQKRPNSWGLYDMLGNVWEWCADGERDYSDNTAIDPIGPLEAGADRVIRGGSWGSDARFCRSAFRTGSVPDYRYSDLGFRCARVQS